MHRFHDVSPYGGATIWVIIAEIERVVIITDEASYDIRKIVTKKIVISKIIISKTAKRETAIRKTIISKTTIRKTAINKTAN